MLDEFERCRFVQEMSELDPSIQDLDESEQYDEALVYALNNVRKFEGPRWFGAIGNGTFFADAEQSMYFPDTTPPEAIGILDAAFGEALTDGLEYL